MCLIPGAWPLSLKQRGILSLGLLPGCEGPPLPPPPIRCFQTCTSPSGTFWKGPSSSAHQTLGKCLPGSRPGMQRGHCLGGAGCGWDRGVSPLLPDSSGGVTLFSLLYLEYVGVLRALCRLLGRRGDPAHFCGPGSLFRATEPVGSLTF